MFWMWGVRRSENPGVFLISAMSRRMYRGTALTRCKLNAAKFLLLLDIDAQFSGVETMDSRQYRHTWVSGIIDLTSPVILLFVKYRAMREMASGGNLFTGCNRFRREGISFRTPCALASRVSI